MTIELLEKDGEFKYIDLINDLVKNSDANKNYKVKSRCEFFVSKNGDSRLLGLVGIDLTRELYPQLQHIILRKDTSPKIGIKLINAMEDFLRKKGEKEYVAFVANNRNEIQIYATRLNLIPYHGNDRGVWFYKKLEK